MFGPMFWGSIADLGGTLKWLTSVIGELSRESFIYFNL